jgi:hypothetical protein
MAVGGIDDENVDTHPYEGLGAFTRLAIDANGDRDEEAPVASEGGPVERAPQGALPGDATEEGAVRTDHRCERETPFVQEVEDLLR